MLVSIGLTTVLHLLRLHKTSRRDAMVRDPRWGLLGRDRDVLLWDKTRVSYARDRDEVLIHLETRLETETSWLRPHSYYLRMLK